MYAEAAPEADADAWYGYGAGYSYGARPYVNLGYRYEYTWTEMNKTAGKKNITWLWLVLRIEFIDIHMYNDKH